MAGKQRIVIVGGGICGLTCALRLAQAGLKPTVFEAAPATGGRTRSFFDRQSGQWVDNGPHLLIGAYRRTRVLLEEIGAEHIRWQNSLELPLWDEMRGMFRFAPPAWLPLATGMLWQAARMPEHGLASVAGMARLGRALRRAVPESITVRQWLESLTLPRILVNDLLAPLCLGAMNEHPDTANAASFARVLSEAFQSHETARLGWFTRPLRQALIKPLSREAEANGARIVTRARLRSLNDCVDADAVVLALPSAARNRLLGLRDSVETRAIGNLHLWFRNMPPLPVSPAAPLIGVRGRWLFDVSAQMDETGSIAHLCLVDSADDRPAALNTRVVETCRLIERIAGRRMPPPFHARLVREVHATAQVRQHPRPALPEHVIDASETPAPGGLPATIELAVRRGEIAANQCFARLGQ